MAKLGKILIGVVVLLIVVRAFLPNVVQWYVNRQLSQMKDYKGRIGDVDIALIRGAYQIENFKLLKANGKVPVPFLSAKRIDFSVQWKALLQGEVVAEIDVASPELNFVDGPTEERSQKEIDSGWRKVIDDLLPLDINRFTARNGEIHFRNLTSNPPVDIHMKELVINAYNLSNTADRKEALPSRVEVKGTAIGGAPFKLNVKLNAMRDPVDFDLNTELKNLELPKLNQFFRAYAGVDIESGTLSVASEIAAKDGTITGYVKPIFTSLDVVELDTDVKHGPFGLFWQSLTGTLADVIQNEDQQGAEIPIKGTLKKPKADVMSAIGSALKHAFDEPLKPGVEGKVNIKSVEN